MNSKIVVLLHVLFSEIWSIHKGVVADLDIYRNYIECFFIAIRIAFQIKRFKWVMDM